MASRGILALLHDRRGNVLPLAAIGMLLSAAIVGGGIDMSRAYRVQNRLQSACDAAALAGRRAVTTNGFDSTIAKPQAESYFDTNFDNSSLETTATSRTFSSPDNGQTIVGAASAELNLAVMKMFGFQKFTLSVTCSASMGVGNSDVVMVLDTTGSMGTALGTGTRMTALRTAMKNFYTTVKTATNGTNARVRYGFVPYSTTVNVGQLLNSVDPSYIASTWAIQSRIATQDGAVYVENNSITNGSKSNYGSTTYGNDSNCGNAVPENTPWTNYGSASNLGTTSTSNNGNGDQRWTTTVEQPQQRTVYECYWTGSRYRIRTYTQYQDRDTNTDWKWTYKQVTYDVSSYKAFNAVTTNTGSYGGAVSSTWKGCIEERGVDFATSPNASPSSSYSYSTTTGMTPYAWDLDIDAAPNATDNKSRWGPMWPQLAYHRYSTTLSSNTGYGVSSACPYQAQLLTEMAQTDFDAYADALQQSGNTYLDVGMVWGGRLSSPEGIFKDNVNVAPTNGGEVSRHIIFMTDGIMEPNNDIQSAWGIEYHDKRVTSDGSSGDTSRHTSRFRAVCDMIKAKGIRIWAISFTSGTSTDLSYCASPNSYYNANDSAELNEAFQEIAKQVGELRITQ
jgi:Flp pilus assembly protein TadG